MGQRSLRQNAAQRATYVARTYLETNFIPAATTNMMKMTEAAEAITAVDKIYIAQNARKGIIATIIAAD